MQTTVKETHKLEADFSQKGRDNDGYEQHLQAASGMMTDHFNLSQHSVQGQSQPEGACRVDELFVEVEVVGVEHRRLRVSFLGTGQEEEGSWLGQSKVPEVLACSERERPLLHIILSVECLSDSPHVFCLFGRVVDWLARWGRVKLVFVTVLFDTGNNFCHFSDDAI